MVSGTLRKEGATFLSAPYEGSCLPLGAHHGCYSFSELVTGHHWVAIFVCVQVQPDEDRLVEDAAYLAAGPFVQLVWFGERLYGLCTKLSLPWMTKKCLPVRCQRARLGGCSLGSAQK